MSRVVERRSDVERGVRRYICFCGGAGEVWEDRCDGFGEGMVEGGVGVAGKREVWSGLFWFDVNYCHIVTRNY